MLEIRTVAGPIQRRAVRVDRRPEGLRGLLLGLVVVLALLGSALSGSAGQAHADCRGVRASFRATCVRDDVATYLSDLATEGCGVPTRTTSTRGCRFAPGSRGRARWWWVGDTVTAAQQTLCPYTGAISTNRR